MIEHEEVAGIWKPRRPGQTTERVEKDRKQTEVALTSSPVFTHTIGFKIVF